MTSPLGGRNMSSSLSGFYWLVVSPFPKIRTCPSSHTHLCTLHMQTHTHTHANIHIHTFFLHIFFLHTFFFLECTSTVVCFSFPLLGFLFQSRGFSLQCLLRMPFPCPVLKIQHFCHWNTKSSMDSSFLFLPFSFFITSAITFDLFSKPYTILHFVGISLISLSTSSK